MYSCSLSVAQGSDQDKSEKLLSFFHFFPLLIPRDAPPLLPSDTTQGYRTVKAKLGCKKVRPWKWMPFTNPARRDGAIFHHWRRVAEEGKDYPFARFNKVGKTAVSFLVCPHTSDW